MSLTLADITLYVEKNIGTFHEKRLASLKKLKLEKLLKRKNPYLFKAKNIILPQSLVQSLLDAHLSSQEETIFGDFLEGLAIFVNEQSFGGRKSAAEGIDLEFDRKKTRFLISIKSGPNWGNSSQVKKMRQSFLIAKKIVRQRNASLNVVAINGCCYGQESRPDKGDYFKYCGQQFWEFISGNSDLYFEIIEPLGHRAKEKNEAFLGQYAEIFQHFTNGFMQRFCQNGLIDWNSLVQFNSKAPTA